MAQGEVATPAGPQTPEHRVHEPKGEGSTTPDQLPSAGPAFALAAGLNRFTFVGQWGIDWDLYTDAAAPLQACLGSWANRWHPSTEQGQFQRSQGRPYEERQYLLRVRGQDALRLILLPYRKGERPAPLEVVPGPAGVVVRSGPLTLTLGAHGYRCSRGVRQSLTAFDAQGVETAGLRVAGGPAELILDGTGGQLTLSGPAGARKIRLPGGWSLAASPTARKADGDWLVNYAGGKPLTLKVEATR
jgi:hypothetical protein